MKPSIKSMDQVRMLSKGVRLGLGWMLMVTLTGAAQATILTYQEGVNGYAGTQDSFIGGLHPRGDAEVVTRGSGENMVVKYGDKPLEEPAGQYEQWRSVIKFTGLGLASQGLTDGSQIVSVKLRLYTTVYETYGTTVSTYGLLKDFKQGGYAGDYAGDGVSWRYANYDASPAGPYPELPWNTYGADATGTAYDSTADRRATADDTVDLYFPSGGMHYLWAEWDVTASFVDQYSNGKEYGWVLSGSGMAPGGSFYEIGFFSSEYTTDPSLRPQLALEFTELPVPEPSVAALLLVAGAVIWRRRLNLE